MYSPAFHDTPAPSVGVPPPAPRAPEPGAFAFEIAGLRFRSDIAAPGARPVGEGSSEADIHIRCGPAPHALSRPDEVGLRYQVCRRQVLFTVDGVARFLVADGNTIIVDRSPGSDAAAIRLFLFGPVLGSLLHQRSEFVVKGSVVDVGGVAVAFVGPSGSGKSTLAAAFSRQGHRVISDELCVLRFGGGGAPLAQPMLPQLHLWPDVLRRCGEPVKPLRPVRHGLQKRILPLGDRFGGPAVRVAKVYLLRPATVSATEVAPLDAGEAYSALENRVFSFVKSRSAEATYRQLAHSLVRCVPFGVVQRARRKLEFERLLEPFAGELKL